MKPGLPIIALAFLALSPAADPSGAVSVSSSLGVYATVDNGCLVSATPASFAASDGMRVSATPAVSVNCTNPTAYSVGLSSAAPRGMTVVGGNVTGSWASMMGYVPASALAAKVGGGAMASPDAAAGTSSLDLHALAKEMLEARARADQSAVARVYPDAITVTISY